MRFYVNQANIDGSSIGCECIKYVRNWYCCLLDHEWNDGIFAVEQYWLIWLREPCFCPMEDRKRHFICDLFPPLFLAKTSLIKYSIEIMNGKNHNRNILASLVSTKDTPNMPVYWYRCRHELRNMLCSILRCVWPNRRTYIFVKMSAKCQNGKIVNTAK